MSGASGKRNARTAAATSTAATPSKPDRNAAAATVGSTAAAAATTASAPNAAAPSSDSTGALTPISSPHDPHVYRHVTLANSLAALLIVDAPKTPEQRARAEQAAKKKTAKRAAATNEPTGEDAGDEDESKPAVVALSVRVGHWCDPAEIPGLAHFCEHMLFMGNKSYPSENEWEEYLSEHGGASNAFTDSELTVYYFEINPKYLTAALQRFAQFFVSPLFAPSATKREIRAVDSEFRDCFNSDPERMSELINHTAALVNPEHPSARSVTGIDINRIPFHFVAT